MRKISKLPLGLGMVLGLFSMLWGSAQAVVINQYTDQSSWISNVGSYVTEDFSDGILAAPLQSITGDDVSIYGGLMHDVIDQGPVNPDTTFTFNPGVFGMGGLWDLAGPGGPGTEIVLRTSSGMYSLGLIPSSTAGTFWGFTIDEALMDVYLVEGPLSSIGVETYTLDNLMMAESPVPEPASLALMGIGLLGIGVAARRKRS